MASVTITRGTTLPDSASKTDFHNLIDGSSGSVSNIVNADIDSAAAIVATKLATIATAGKVSGAALTSLSSIPSGAGVIPIANLATGTPDGTKYVRDDGTLVLPNVAAVAGMVVQVVNVTTGATSSGSTAMVIDDTIPQNSEGNEVMTLAITPKSASNKLKIDVVVYGTNSTGVSIAVALFQDSTANSLAAVASLCDAATSYADNTISFTHYMVAGTASETTFKVRAGGTSGTFVFNGNSGGRLFGGVAASSITITEIKV